MASRENLIKVSKDIKEALLTNNIESLKRLYMEDFQGYSIRGEVETLDLIIQFYQPGTSTLTSYEIKEKTVEVFGEVGIISGTGYVAGKFGEYAFEHHIRFTDIYLCKEGQWRCYRSQATELPEDL